MKIAHWQDWKKVVDIVITTAPKQYTIGDLNIKVKRTLKEQGFTHYRNNGQNKTL
jgi:hypothetical protein